MMASFYAFLCFITDNLRTVIFEKIEMNKICLGHLNLHFSKRIRADFD